MKESISMVYFRAAFDRWFRQSGLKQHQAGTRLGISQSLVTKLLRGERAVSFAQADEIAQGLKTTVAKMIEDGERITNKDTAKNNMSKWESEAIEAFKLVLKKQNDSAAKMILKNVIDYAAQDVAEDIDTNPTQTQLSKSA